MSSLLSKKLDKEMYEDIINQLKADKHLLTTTELRGIYPYATIMNINKYIGYLNAYFSRYSITAPLRQCAFLAQIGHESGQLRYCEELASGQAYENRKDLGNTQRGDGVRFKGRGLIQITGRYNYEKFGKEMSIDLINHPEMLCYPEYATLSAFIFWSDRKLNDLADKEDMEGITRKINGGLRGLADRMELYENAKKILL